MADDFNITGASGTTNNEDKGLQLTDLWELIWHNKFWYIISLIICLLAAGFYIYRTPNQYQSTERIIIEDDQTTSVINGLSNSRSSLIYSDKRVANETHALRSPDLMANVVERMGLETFYIDKMFLRERDLYNRTPFYLSLLGDNKNSSFTFLVKKKGEKDFEISDFKVGDKELKEAPIKGSLGDSLVTPIGSIRLTESPYLYTWSDDIIVSWAPAKVRARKLVSHLTVSPTKDESSVVTLSFVDESPMRAANILANLLDVYNEQWIANKNLSATNTSKFIQERLVIIEEELGGIEKDIKDYKQANRLTNLSAVAQQDLQQSASYSNKAFETSNQIAISQYLRERLTDPTQARSLLPANSGLTNGNIESQIQKYNETLMHRDRLLKESSEANPLVQDLNANLDAMRTNITRSVDNSISALQLQQDKILAREGNLQGRLVTASSHELQLLSMDRQQKVKESLYVYLLQKREENELAAQLSVANTRLILAPVSGRLVAPNRQMILLVALILGLGIPFLFFFLKSSLNTTVHTRSDISNVKVPFLAEIPQMGLGKGILKKRIHRFNDENCNILVQHGKRDMMNEAFRVLRTNIDMMVGGKSDTKVFMVTSFNPNAGKTFCIMNMAASMAVKGSKVLLLDLDMRKATLSKALGKNNTGVAAYLNGRHDDYRSSIQEISENLYLFSVGTLPPNPAELLVSQKFRDMIESLRSEYDYIFMDCPPIDVVADTAIVSSSADITIFIIRAGLFDKRGLPALNELYNDGKYNRMAIILNGVEQIQGSYGHYGYGSYGYGYGHYGYGYGYGESDDTSADGKKKHHRHHRKKSDEDQKETQA